MHTEGDTFWEGATGRQCVASNLAMQADNLVC